MYYWSMNLKHPVVKKNGSFGRTVGHKFKNKHERRITEVRQNGGMTHMNVVNECARFLGYIAAIVGVSWMAMTGLNLLLLREGVLSCPMELTPHGHVHIRLPDGLRPYLAAVLLLLMLKMWCARVTDWQRGGLFGVFLGIPFSALALSLCYTLSITVSGFSPFWFLWQLLAMGAAGAAIATGRSRGWTASLMLDAVAVVAIQLYLAGLS